MSRQPPALLFAEAPGDSLLLCVVGAHSPAAAAQLGVRRMKSPDGNIEVVREKNFAPPDVAKWCGWIEIPGRQFPLRGRKFTDPMVFSPNSRFLALTELTATGQQMCRVVVLDFLTDKQIIVYDEKSKRIDDMANITSLRWTDDVTLRICTFAGSDFSQGERVQVWKAA